MQAPLKETNFIVKGNFFIHTLKTIELKKKKKKKKKNAAVQLQQSAATHRNPNIGSGAAPGIQFSTSEREPPWGGQC